MNHRHLGRSGLLVSEISYGNWITHGSQVEKDAAVACVRAALDEGITTFDTADVYAATRAEEVPGEALAGQRRAGLEIFTKVFWPTEAGVGQIVWSPIAQGVLSGKYLPGQPPPEGSRATDESGAKFIADDVLGRVQKLKPVAEEIGLSTAQIAVAWVLQNGNVSSAIVGASRPEQVRDNVRASGVKLDDVIMKRIDDVLGEVVERVPKRTVCPAKRP